MAKLSKEYTVNTYNQELLQCAAISFFIKFSDSTNGEFFEYIENFAENSDPSGVLDSVFAEYGIKNNLGVYHTSNATGISWIRSSIDIARFLIKKLNLNKNFEIHHQKSEFGKLLKDECIKSIIEALNLKNISSKFDVYNPTDIWIVNKNYISLIKQELNKYIVENTTTDGISSILSNYITNEHTYKSILDKFYEGNKLYQISLKKSKTANLISDDTYKNLKNTTLNNVGYKIVGTMMNYSNRKMYIDSYTKFVFAFDELLREGNKNRILKFIDDLVHVDKLNYKDEVLQPNLIFHLDYEGVAIDGGGLEKWKLDTPGNTFNMQKIGGTAWSGGLNSNGVHEILKNNYKKYESVFKEMSKLRINAFEKIYKELTNESSIPTSVNNILGKSEIIYKSGDLKLIEDHLNSTAYVYFLVKAIENLSEQYRGVMAKYGISSSGGLQLTKKLKSVVIKNGKEKEVTEIVSTLKSGQNVVRLITEQLVKGQSEIKYEKVLSGKITQVKSGDFIFIEDKNNKIKNGTKIVSIDRSKKIVKISSPLIGGTKQNSPQSTAIILNPMQTNIVSSDELSKIKGTLTNSKKYLEEKFSKLQSFYMFMSGGPELLNEVLKKQIVLTIYGLVSKKGGKLFDPDLYDEVKGKIFTKNALSKYVIPSFIIVGD